MQGVVYAKYCKYQLANKFIIALENLIYRRDKNMEDTITKIYGGKWWKTDFHVHTPASEDYGKL